MSETRRFDFDSFDELLCAVLDSNEAVMDPIVRRPGAIGSVACRPTFLEADPAEPAQQNRWDSEGTYL